MAKSYTHLTPDERYYSKTRLNEGESLSEIARSLGRAPSTVSHETIYQLVWRDKREGGDLHTRLRHAPKKQRRRYGKNDFRGRIPGRVDISERPDNVEERARIGHWEGDTVIGGGHRGGLVTLAERRSRALLAGRISRETKAETASVLCRITEGLGDIFDTITYDNGREFSDHALVFRATGSDAYFARPYRSWGRGLQRALQRPAPPVLPQIDATRPDHRRASPEGRLQN